VVVADDQSADTGAPGELSDLHGGAP
jgi:hypothetical protein